MTTVFSKLKILNADIPNASVSSNELNISIICVMSSYNSKNLIKPLDYTAISWFFI